MYIVFKNEKKKDERVCGIFYTRDQAERYVFNFKLLDKNITITKVSYKVAEKYFLAGKFIKVI